MVAHNNHAYTQWYGCLYSWDDSKRFHPGKFISCRKWTVQRAMRLALAWSQSSAGWCQVQWIGMGTGVVRSDLYHTRKIYGSGGGFCCCCCLPPWVVVCTLGECLCEAPLPLCGFVCPTQSTSLPSGWCCSWGFAAIPAELHAVRRFSWLSPRLTLDPVAGVLTTLCR